MQSPELKLTGDYTLVPSERLLIIKADVADTKVVSKLIEALFWFKKTSARQPIMVNTSGIMKRIINSNSNYNKIK